MWIIFFSVVIAKVFDGCYLNFNVFLMYSQELLIQLIIGLGVFLFCFSTIVFSIQISIYICVVFFSFLCITVFEIRLFDAVKSIGYGPRRTWFGRVVIEMNSVRDRLDFRA